jgi:hypothetical protein
MADADSDPYFVTIDDTLVGRRPGDGAERMARELRRRAPLRSALAES